LEVQEVDPLWEAEVVGEMGVEEELLAWVPLVEASVDGLGRLLF